MSYFKRGNNQNVGKTIKEKPQAISQESLDYLYALMGSE